jgi:hypothetical protein
MLARRGHPGADSVRGGVAMPPDRVMYETPFNITTRDINHAAIAQAAGQHVETYRQPAGRRALFSFADTPEIRDLLNRYERRECLTIPAKSVLNAKTELYHQAARIVREVQL